MCIFSGEVESVSKTNIFARLVGDRQVLVYGMSIRATEEVAMILPIPVAPASREDSVNFISLEDYPDFFADMAKPFRSKSLSFDDTSRGGETLKVHRVGCFDASYVPSVTDFDRLDARFRLPKAAAEHPPYREYGFVVFQLRAGQHEVHPMAFSFITGSSKLFFPTIHVHDGSHMPEWEEFDHALYAQEVQSPDTQEGRPQSWFSTDIPAGKFMNIAKCNSKYPIVDSSLHCLRRLIGGMAANADIWL